MVNDEFVDGPLTGSRGRLDSMVGVLSRQLSCPDHNSARAAAPSRWSGGDSLDDAPFCLSRQVAIDRYNSLVRLNNEAMVERQANP